jgi:hypothetical protein
MAYFETRAGAKGRFLGFLDRAGGADKTRAAMENINRN